MIEKPAVVELLHDHWGGFGVRERVLDSLFPFALRQIAPDADAAAAPS